MFKSRKGLISFLLGILLIFIAIILGSFYYIFEIKYANKIYPNVYIAGINMDGKTLLEAKSLIDEKINIVNQDGVSFYYDNNKVTIYPINSSPDAAVVDVLIDFKINETIDEAMFFGRSGNYINDFKSRIDLFFNKNHHIKLIANFDSDKIINDLKQGFSIFSPQNATYYFDSENNLSIKQGKAGKEIYYEKSIVVLKDNLGELNFSNIVLEGNNANPEISEADCLTMKDKVESVLALAPIKLKYNEDEWIINKTALLEMISLSKKEGNLSVDLDKNKIKKYITEKVAAEINQDYVLPKFTLNGGNVENFKPGKEGRALDVDLTVNLLLDLIKNPFKELNLSVKILPYSTENGEINDVLGIKEIVGRYSLEYEGSTSARISNIKNGAKSLNGLLLKPDEEFSMLKALGSIDEEHGYAKEAVIKGDAIYYEFGGGLCHTSTTLFRAVLDAGLPVTMRQNHSYNMPYYQPAGIDATIYNPYPDFKFINDTGNYILIQAEADYREMTIELWGINDGRIIKRTEPVIYNIVNPRPSKMINTDKLVRGVVKCTYAAYDGADAYFDYEVTYPNGIVKKERFSSHYIPRQGVCSIGI